MKAILKKTINSRFGAGDVIRGDSKRIKSLVNQGVAIYDHSMLAMIGNILSIVTSAAIIGFLVAIKLPGISKLVDIRINLIWSFTIIAIAFVNLSMNLAYFINAKRPYLTYFLAFIINPIAGLMILIGHEKMASKYQNRNISASMGVTLITTASITLSILILALINNNIHMFPTFPGIGNKFMFPLFIVFLTSGFVTAIMTDNSYSSRRRRYISFLRRQNAKIEYKTKALNAYKAYLNTGNSDKFMEENIELLEETLKVDRTRLKE